MKKLVDYDHTGKAAVKSRGHAWKEAPALGGQFLGAGTYGFCSFIGSFCCSEESLVLEY